MSYFHRSVTSNLGNLLTWRQLFRAMFRPFSIQIDWSVASRIVALLVGAIDALSGGLHTYFLMRELSGGIHTKKYEKLVCSHYSYNTKQGKWKGKLLPKIEEITVGKAHANTRKLNRNILTVTAVFLNQKRMNVCEHISKMGSLESFVYLSSRDLFIFR